MTKGTTMTTKPIHPSPRWLRALAVDADVYGDRDLAEMIYRARRGDDAALEACRKAAEQLAR